MEGSPGFWPYPVTWYSLNRSSGHGDRLPRTRTAFVLSQIHSQGCVTPQTRARGSARTREENLLFLKELLEDGRVTPVIDRTYSLSEVPEAIRYLAERHARGNVVITV